jgi:hypothetical protein
MSIERPYFLNMVLITKIQIKYIYRILERKNLKIMILKEDSKTLTAILLNSMRNKLTQEVKDQRLHFQTMKNQRKNNQLEEEWKLSLKK